VYGFGVVLLELLTGRKSVDKSRPAREQNLVEWARPYLTDARRLGRVMDRNLAGQYPAKAAQKAAALAHRCVSLNPKSRPHMSAVVEALEPLLALDDDCLVGTFVYVAPPDDVAANGDGSSKRRAGRRRSDGAAAGAAAAADGQEAGTRQRPALGRRGGGSDRRSGERPWWPDPRLVC
jgi:hypothetical protein